MFSLSIARIHLMDKKQARPDPCDWQIIQCSNCLQLISCILDIVAMVMPQAQDLAEIVGIIVDLFTMSVGGCMGAQVTLAPTPTLTPTPTPTLTMGGCMGAQVYHEINLDPTITWTLTLTLTLTLTQIYHEINLDVNGVVNHPVVMGVPVGAPVNEEIER